MDFKSIFKVLSLIGMTLGLFFFLDIFVGWLYNELYLDFLVYDLLFILLNALIFFLLRRYKVTLKIRESILSVNLLWILIGVAGAIPLVLYTPVTFADGFFEAISGFTTTGATVYGDIEDLPRMILFHRSLMHWLGGVGVIVLSVGLLSFINPTGSLSLFKAESTGIQIEKFRPKIRETALSLWGIYLLITLADTILLKLFGMNWFDAINHAFSTVSTGGFSTKNDSLGHFHSLWIIWTTTFFMMISGINFLAHLKLLYGDASGYKSEEVKWYMILFLLLGGALTLVHMDMGHDGWLHASTHAFFTIASVMTTTGFATIDYGTWSHLAVALIFIAMLIGGNAGSTAGGIKVIRYVVISKTLIAELKKILHPKALLTVFIDGVKLQRDVMASTFGFFALFIFTLMILSIYIFARGYDMMTAVSGALAIVGNIGPGFAKVGPSDNFAFFSDWDKVVLSVGMIIGRLECYTVYILFTASFWKRF